MTATFKELTDFFRTLGADGVSHTDKTYLAHAIAVYNEDFGDLCVVHLCDWLEQVERSGNWDYRRAAYRSLAERLGGVALASYERVFANAPA